MKYEASGELWASIFFYPLMAITLSSPMFLTYFMFRNRTEVYTSKFKDRFGTLTLGLNAESSIAIYYWTTFNQLKLLFTALILYLGSHVPIV